MSDLAEIRSHAESAARLMRAMANPMRLNILCVLAENELPVGELNNQIDLSQSALSQHLAILREEALVSTRRDGQMIYYRVTEGPALKIIKTLHEAYCGNPTQNPNRSSS